ncbi:MAG: tRNA pseudouridine(55) synthase TruB [Proteobacteria bacterium]|nr:tRNA pseudouridine(55) synthase TruB [Pseudomonadota bacterium]
MARRKKGNPVHGWLILDKPYGMGSTPAVSFARRVFNAQKAGHGGTLDPLAEGVLPIALGEATKTLPYILDADKTYRFTLRFGTATATGDAEGDIVATSDVRPTEAQIQAILPQFTGGITQTPPAYSALKIDGKPAYERARAGETVEIPSRDVTIYSLKLRAYTPEESTFEAEVSKGTYIRSLGQDMAVALGSCGHLSYLRRLKAGPFDEKMAITKETLENCLQNGHSPQTVLHPPEVALADIPAHTADAQDRQTLKTGRVPDWPGLAPGTYRVHDKVNGQLLSLVSIGADAEGTKRILRNFNLDETDIAKE